MGKERVKKGPVEKQGLQYELTCMCCPVGCKLRGTLSPEAESKIIAHTCPVGWSYAAQEQRIRTRMVTALVPVTRGTVPLRVRSSKPVLKENIYQVLTELSKVTATVPIFEGQSIVKDICGFEVDIVAAEEYY